MTLCKHAELITDFNLPFSPSTPNKTVRHRKRGCRWYISAKRQGKYTKLGNKRPYKHKATPNENDTNLTDNTENPRTTSKSTQHNKKLCSKNESSTEIGRVNERRKAKEIKNTQPNSDSIKLFSSIRYPNCGIFIKKRRRLQY